MPDHFGGDAQEFMDRAQRAQSIRKGMTADDEAMIRKSWASGQAILAMRAIRETYGVDLGTAKLVVDGFR